MARLIVLAGPPGSGKTTWANLFERLTHCSVVSRDKIRFSKLKEEDDYFKYEDEVKKEFYNTIREELQEGYVVLADATHLNKKSRKPLVEIGKELKVAVDGIYFIPSLKECIENNNKREGREKVPLSALKKMYFSFEPPQYEEGFTFINKKGERS